MTTVYAGSQHDSVSSAELRTRSASKVDPTTSSTRARWTGRTLSAIGVLFLTFDATLKVFEVQAATESGSQLGYPTSLMFGIGLLEVICLIVYLIPRTAILGAVLWTGYLGGAIATHVRVGNPLFSHVLFPVYIAALLWVGLWLREPRLRTLLPFLTRKD